MIYLVTKEQRLFNSEVYEIISVEESLRIMSSWRLFQYDSETSGRDPHICKLLCIQFGNKQNNTQIVVDCNTIDILEYKDFIESHYMIGHNLKFDLQFLYNYNIIPRKVYDTMIVEQLLYLGYPTGTISYSLKETALRYLNVDIDKTVRGEIIWRGLDERVVKYAAGDVLYLEDICAKQHSICVERNCTAGAKLECDAVPAMAYMEWCGIKLDEDKWKSKMLQDKTNLDKALSNLNSYVLSDQKFKHFTKTDRQLDLFSEFDPTPKCIINWDSPKQVVDFCKFLGFNTTVTDKSTGEDKDSVLEKVLKTQKGIDDIFLNLYFEYKEYSKVCSTYGQGHLNAVNPNTGRIHTVYKQLGAASGRMSCGSKQPNTDLAKLKKLKPSECSYPNMQQLPADDITRGSFVAPEGYKFVSADFSAEESRLGADIYQDEEFLQEFLFRSGDTHSMFAWAVFKKQCIECGCKDVNDVKQKAPKWRKKVKAVEFAYLFGAAAPTLSKAADCSVEEAQQYIDVLDKTFTGVSKFAKKGSKFVRDNGYINICKYTGHKLYWYNHKEWLKQQESFTSDFWDDYRAHHKGTNDYIANQVRKHFQVAGNYDRLARNVVTQGTGAIIMKSSLTMLFNWIVDNNYFNKIHLCAAIHDK